MGRRSLTSTKLTTTSWKEIESEVNVAEYGKVAKYGKSMRAVLFCYSYNLCATMRALPAYLGWARNWRGTPLLPMLSGTNKHADLHANIPIC